MVPPSKIRYIMSYAASICALTTGVLLFSIASIPGALLWLAISVLFALVAKLSKPNH